MIDLLNLSVQFTGDYLFENVNLKINKEDKIALVGSNGTGKSTILKILAGQELPESGSINKQKKLRIGYLPQEFLHFQDRPLFHEVKSSLDDIKRIVDTEETILDKLNSEIVDHDEKESLLFQLGDIHHIKEDIDFYSVDSRIEKILIGLGFKESEFLKSTRQFSGGWQMRIQLAKILLAENHIILLDEPTNHLDIDSLQWIVEYLQRYRGSIIVVSHDRYFINTVTQKTLEIFNKNVTFFNGKYDHYLKYCEERAEQLESVQKTQQKKIKETERFIERFRYKSTKSKQVQSRIKQLEKLERVELSSSEDRIKVRFPEPPRSGVIPMELKGISKAFGDNVVFENINLVIERGEKIALVGPNGAGKTTLSRIIANKLEPDSGEIKLGHNTAISYYAQEVAENLDGDKDIIDSVSDISDELTIPQLRTVLGSFLFTGEDVFKKVSVLSGGEKSRVALAKILLTKANLIVLDEPTNHLDFNSKAILQEALKNFNGSLILVSHDIEFLQPLVTKVYEVRNQSIKGYHGGIDYYLFKQKEEADENNQQADDSKDKFNRKAQKRQEAELRQKKSVATKVLRELVEKLETELDRLENLKTGIETELADPTIFSNPEKSKKKNEDYSKVKNDLEKVYDEWAIKSEELSDVEELFDI
ncbi:MAG: ABC-F family ATP-binding cassette domain-containing protein [Bacteroidetes bacterium]|nr:ABC-F family ATP-binding cassette domain-containing protein [Bacteroidota bacterium]